MSSSARTLRLLLGDQLNGEHSWLNSTDDTVCYVMMEVRSEATYVKHHVQKIVAFFLAMRTFAEELRAAGHRVHYLRLDDADNRQAITANLQWLLQEYGAERFEYQLPDEWRLDEELTAFAESLDLETNVVDSEHFLAERDTVEKTFAGKKSYLMETFYRNMRKRYDILMEADGESPLKGQWNFDKQNRGKLPKKITFPDPPRFTRDVSDLVSMIEAAGIETMGRLDPEQFDYPVTQEEARQQLSYFCEQALAHFGTYQDAMTTRDELLFHSRLSFCLNSKLITPLEVVRTAVDYWRAHQEEITFNQIEGFVRQIIGWREYMRGVYWAQGPAYAEKNFFGHDRPLPEWYWTGKTKMKCLEHSINQSLDHAYAHHIQRLMVTGNFAMIYGADPDAVDAWYLGVYIDAIQWVEITNTRGMSQWADGGLLATKPYAASANYIHKMSDYCTQCPYDRNARTGENACPYNSLYWDFLDRNADKLQDNFRMGLVYKAWERFSAEDRAEILERADWVKTHVNEL